MSQTRQRNENDDDDESDDESTRRNSSDGLEFVPTLLKIKQVVLLRHSTFHRLINEFNQTLESFTRDETHFLQFQVIPQTDSTIFWKALVRIRCQKVKFRHHDQIFSLKFHLDLSSQSKYRQ